MNIKYCFNLNKITVAVNKNNRKVAGVSTTEHTSLLLEDFILLNFQSCTIYMCDISLMCCNIITKTGGSKILDQNIIYDTRSSSSRIFKLYFITTLNY